MPTRWHYWPHFCFYPQHPSPPHPPYPSSLEIFAIFYTLRNTASVTCFTVSLAGFLYVARLPYLIKNQREERGSGGWESAVSQKGDVPTYTDFPKCNVSVRKVQRVIPGSAKRESTLKTSCLGHGQSSQYFLVKENEVPTSIYNTQGHTYLLICYEVERDAACKALRTIPALGKFSIMRSSYFFYNYGIFVFHIKRKKNKTGICLIKYSLKNVEVEKNQL